MLNTATRMAKTRQPIADRRPVDDSRKAYSPLLVGSDFIGLIDVETEVSVAACPSADMGETQAIWRRGSATCGEEIR